MSFPSDSPFYQRSESEQPKTSAFSVRKVGQADIVEVPISVLEDWLTVVERQFEYPDGADLEDLCDAMRSYFKG